jgi:hypothetical protein
MKWKPNPLLYAADIDFYSSFTLSVTMSDPVDHAILSRAVEIAMPRYPYFCITPERSGNHLMLAFNPRPVAVFCDGRCAALGSEECNGHLLSFGCEGDRILLHASHYIADGMGIVPLLKTVLYLYASERYGTDGLQSERILMPDSPVAEEEYADPFSGALPEIDDPRPARRVPDTAYAPDPEAFDEGGLYAYHLRIPQKAMMAKANPSDGSPVSFLTTMLYRAMGALDDAIALPIVAHVQHQYRAALRTPLCRHSMVSYIPAVLPVRAKDWDVELQNTVLRGQIILDSDVTADLCAVRRLVEAMPRGEDVTLAERKRAMRSFVENSICGKSFGISYVGKMDWSGLDRYVEDVQVYIGEKHARNMILIEVMTIGEDFTLTFMQGGRGRRYVDAFVEQIRAFDIPVEVVGEERYALCDTVLPD